MAKSGFAEALVKRLRIRRDLVEGEFYELDLRHRRFGNRNHRIVRNPADPGWPRKGRRTSDLKTAQRWVREHYAPQLEHELEAVQTAPDIGTVTVQQACERYVAHRMALLGPGGLRSINSRISMLRRHVLPAFGPLPFASLTKQMVRAALEHLTVRKPGRRPGQRTTAPAELGTKRNFLRSLMAVWHHALPDVACPFSGLRITDEEGMASRRRAIEEGDLTTLLAPESGALTPSEFRQAVVGAMYYDVGLGRRPNTKVLMVPNTASAMVIQTALGLRISELIMLRWGAINFEQRYVFVTGTKTRRSFRVVPLQDQLVPWLEELRATEGGSPDPRSFVIRTNPRRGLFGAASHSTLVNRYARALKQSGMKRPKKSTHWTRATHATWGAASPVITTEALKAYLGHQTRYGGSTDAYVHVMLEVMPDEHRRYITYLPTPNEVRAAMQEYEPADLGPWRDRRVWQSRSTATKRAQRERAVARRPMHASLDPSRVTADYPLTNSPGSQGGVAAPDVVPDFVPGASEAENDRLQLARKLLRSNAVRGGLAKTTR